MEAAQLPPHLRWSCRRGMLELDVLLGNFLEEAFLNLNEKDQADFVRLLDNNDQDLFTWLTGRMPAPDAADNLIVGKIRQHAQTRHNG
jgi:antitoxin CptB